MRRLALIAPVLVLVVLLIAAPALAHQKPLGNRVDNRLDATLAKVRAKVGMPGVQAVLVRRGRVLWSARQGVAIAATKAPVKKRTLFALGSFGKLLICAYALDRAEAGVLDLDAPISKYVGDSIPGAASVSSRMLLAQTAGYPDVYSSAEVAPLFEQYDPDRQWSFATLLPGIHEPVDPGARWAYSNTGYIVLGRVLDAVTKQPLERAFRRFARAAGVAEPELTLRRSASAARHFAHGYISSGSGTSDSFAGAAGIPTDLYGLPWTDGAFAGTARGAARFLDALFVRGTLLRRRSVRHMVKPTSQSIAAGPSGEMLSYGLGTASYRAAGRVWHGHDGTYAGFTTMGATDVRRGVSIAVVTNLQAGGQQAAIELWRALSRAYGR